MPKPIIEMALAARKKDVYRLVELKDLEIEEMKKPLPRKNTKMFTILKEIFTIFEPYVSQPNPDDPVWALPASQFDYLAESYSQPSVIKAKKLLGIRSIKLSDRWCWTFPQRAPEKSMELLYQKQLATWRREMRDPIKEVKKNLRPAATKLKEVMARHDYDVLGTVVMQEMGYSRQGVIRMKAVVGVASIKKADGWHWVYPAQEVQDWLLEQLSEGPVAVTALFKNEHGWSPEVIRMAHTAVGGIRSQLINNVLHWRLQ